MVLARAERRRRRHEIRTGGHRIVLEPRAWLARGYDVSVSSGVIGSISSQGWVSSSIQADLPRELGLLLRIFLVYLVLVARRRQAAAAAAGG
jgi:hypothetical protein